VRDQANQGYSSNRTGVVRQSQHDRMSQNQQPNGKRQPGSRVSKWTIFNGMYA
jgi:hypothetical protein